MTIWKDLEIHLTRKANIIALHKIPCHQPSSRSARLSFQRWENFRKSGRNSTLTWTKMLASDGLCVGQPLRYPPLQLWSLFYCNNSPVLLQLLMHPEYLKNLRRLINQICYVRTICKISSYSAKGTVNTSVYIEDKSTNACFASFRRANVSNFNASQNSSGVNAQFTYVILI